MSFLEDLSSKTTLRRAWERVAAKRSVAGIDRVSIDDFRGELERHLTELRTRSAPSATARCRCSGSARRSLRPPTGRWWCRRCETASSTAPSPTCCRRRSSRR
jgi:hypothetical protein